MKDDPYGKLQRCIHVSILDFIHFPEDQECYRKIHFRDGRTGKLFSDRLEIQMLELRKLPEGIAGGDGRGAELHPADEYNLGIDKLYRSCL